MLMMFCNRSIINKGTDISKIIKLTGTFKVPEFFNWVGEWACRQYVSTDNILDNIPSLCGI